MNFLKKLAYFLIASGRLEPTPIASRSDPQQRIILFSTVLKPVTNRYNLL